MLNMTTRPTNTIAALAVVLSLSINALADSVTDFFLPAVQLPFIPDASATLMRAMQVTDDTWPDDVKTALNHLGEGHAFSVPDVLFRKITDEERENWQERFAGTRD